MREIDNFVALVRGVPQDATVLLIEHNMPWSWQLAHRITVLEPRRDPGRG